MAGDRLTSSEKRALLLWVAAGIVGLLFAYKYFFQAFPEASINFKISREDALSRARKFVTGLGENLSGYKSSIIFDVDEDAKVYLERQLGLKEANQLMLSEVNVWNWEVRFFKPGQEEEFRIAVSPEGKVTGYLHKVPEAQAGAEPARETAQKAAQDFLTAKLGKAFADWDFLPEESNSEKKPHRLDWAFTWERHGFRAKDAPERLGIHLNGGEVGGAREALKVPEQWERDYRHLRSTNEFYNLVAVIPYLLALGSVLWLGIRLTRAGQTNWRLALQLGVVVAAFLVAMQLNRWPLDLSEYDTNTAYGSFAIQQIMGALVFGIGMALTVTLVLPGGEPLYREAKPQFLRLKKALTLRGVRTKEFFSSTIVGLSFAAAHMGFLVVFYLIANRFGAWAPQEVNYEDSVSTAVPWISGIAIGLLAAASEEFLFRLFAIPFLQRLTKSRVLAVVLPAFSWGFLHTAYPNEPPYIRGLEVGLIGIAAGIVMLHWGILATLIWHYTVDASLVGLLLVRSNSLYFRISGVVVGLAVLIPFGIGVFSRVRRGAFEEDDDLLNQVPDPEEARSEKEPVPAIEAAPTGPLSKGILGLLSVCVVLGGLAALKIKSVHLGDYLKLSVNAKEATEQSREILKQRGVDPRNYNSATTFVDVTDAIANEYLRQKIGTRALNAIYEKRVPGALWDTRFFRDGEAEEYSVILRPDGSLHSVHHDLAEAAQGASMSKEEAIAGAATFLQTVKGVDLSSWALVDSSSDKKPHRVDHKLVWQENQPLDGSASAQTADPRSHAFARIQVSVVGDEVTNFRTFVKIPDEWRREQEGQSVPRTALNIFAICFVLGLGGTALVFFLLEIKSELMRQLPWRRFAVWGTFAWGAYIVLVVFGDRIQEALVTQYKTAVPLKFMYAGLGIGFFIGSFFYLGLTVVLFAVTWLFLRQAYGDAELPGWHGMPAQYYRDALFIGIGGTAALIALGRATEWASGRWPAPHRAFPAGFGTDFDSYFPGVSILATAILHALLLTGVVGAVSGFLLAHCKSSVIRGLLFAGASLAMVSGWGSPADFIKLWIARVVFLAVVVSGVSRVLRVNLLGYFLVLAVPSLILGADELLEQANRFYQLQGMIVIAALALLLAWPLAAWRFSSIKLTAGNT